MKILGIVLAALLTLTACSGPTVEGETSGSYEVITVQYNGRVIPCVVWDGYNSGGIDCNWETQ